MVVTWPPSARYSPQLHANRTLGPQDPSSVWAVLLPVLESPQQPTVEVSFVLHCGRAELDLSMEHRQGRLWVGRLSGVPGAFCSGTIAHIQVKASDGSCSELRPVTVGRRGDSLEFVQPQAYMPLDLSWVDWGRSIALRVDWPYWGYRAMFAVWGFLFFGLLCLPRLAVSRGWNHCLDEWLESRQAALRFVLRWLLYPAIILMDTASLPQIWNPLAVYYGYLGVGPWAAVRFLEGEPLGLYQLGRVFYFLGGKPSYVQNVDTSIATVIHMSLTLLPLTLVFASAVSRVKRMAVRPTLWSLASIPHLLLLLLVLYPNWMLLRRFAFANLGVLGLLVNVMAWPTPFFAFLLLRLSWMLAGESGGGIATEYKSD